MKNKITIISLSIVLVALLLVVLVKTNNKEETFQQDGITYALKVNGTSSTSFPAKGLYKVNISCTNATGRWDYVAWKLYLEEITGDVSCSIDFTTIEKTNLNDKIISLSGTRQGNGQVVEENGYRYEGKNPNNYIWFNNELWRIIGVFDETSHGQTGQNLVKIIRNLALDSISWGSTSSNNWSISSIKKLLNPIDGDSDSGAYYKKVDGTNSIYCAKAEYSKSKCNFVQNGIEESYRRMIKNVTWYLGGVTDPKITTEAMYGYERGETVYSGNPTTDTGYIGLMYPSDYGYASFASSCDRTTNLYSYNKNAECAGQNWLTGKGAEWIITSMSTTNNEALYLYSDGGIGEYNTINSPLSIRPTLYLEASVYVIEGDGSITNPYIIDME